ncbi:MAG TPA: YgiT-type zinc finger protein [Candidatus Sulfotelmatobacter sp.]|nr:YgiT-type zinc finger protein [Candidatus Sulfotelmatobacter sp.]
MAENHKTEKELAEFLEEAEEACEACGGELAPEKVNLEDYQGGKLYMMENVPAYVCQECGEIWVPEPQMQEFEKMIETAKHSHPTAPRRSTIKKRRIKNGN